jgi:hypothetical protein
MEEITNMPYEALVVACNSAGADETKAAQLRAELERRESLRSQTKSGIESLIKNYLDKGRTEGGRWTLHEAQRELQRREGTNYSGLDATRNIIKLAQQSEDGLTTYMEVWREFYPDQDWTGHGTQQQAKAILAAAISYCVDHQLPIVTTAVVSKGDRQASELAKKNIYKEVEKLGVDTGPDVEAFYEEQLRLTQEIVLSDLES